MAHRVHLDYSSTAPMRPEVRTAMSIAIGKDPFDPRRLYENAIETRYSIENARIQVANFFDCDPFEVIFTGSHSESLATFAFGCVDTKQKTSVIATPYDSEIIHKTWSAKNIDINYLDGNQNAKLELKNLSDLVTQSTTAITIPFAHPDTGTLQDIEQIADTVRNENPNCLIHVDARLACGNIPIEFSQMNIDAMSVDPVTFGGPSGVAALILSRSQRLTPLLKGATQERARRAGLENHIGITGFGVACESASKTLEQEIFRFQEFKKIICEEVKSAGAKFLVHDDESNKSLPNIAHAYFPGVAASMLVAEFNRNGINIHAGSSCGSEEFEPSKQLAPVTQDDSVSESVFRMSWGWATQPQDIDEFVRALKSIPIPQ